ncbi:acyl carrier protein [Methylobacterium sp. SyP6R]|uniref:acyl carrier protein n=1 Tax=Methylobacterium sp. SyP6R TaxID=2718876 RepID=UPI001F47B787|nr:acyl carrier protein [Methylobacterium sp. SyP6R]MCF4130028.1 acyl carrier protein [Methylobacterium sp. SyP6R]
MDSVEINKQESVFAASFWDAVKTKQERSEDVSYLDLGGTSLGIFIFTEKLRKELGITIPPQVLLEDDATLANLKSKYLPKNEG